MMGSKEARESGSSVFIWFRKRKKKESIMALETGISSIDCVCIWKREEIVQNLRIGMRINGKMCVCRSQKPSRVMNSVMEYL